MCVYMHDSTLGGIIFDETKLFFKKVALHFNSYSTQPFKVPKSSSVGLRLNRYRVCSLLRTLSIVPHPFSHTGIKKQWSKWQLSIMGIISWPSSSKKLILWWNVFLLMYSKLFWTNIVNMQVAIVLWIQLHGFNPAMEERCTWAV